MASTRLISDHDWYSHHQTMPTTLWVANAVISAALFAGPLAGITSAIVMAAVSAVVRDQVNLDLWADATAPVLVACGVAMGFAMRTARTAHRQLEEPCGSLRPQKSATGSPGRSTTASFKCSR